MDKRKEGLVERKKKKAGAHRLKKRFLTAKKMSTTEGTGRKQRCKGGEDKHRGSSSGNENALKGGRLIFLRKG